MVSNTDPPKSRRWAQIFANDNQFPLHIRHPRFIHRVKSGKSLVDDREKETIYRKEKDPLQFQKWIFRNSQLVHNDDGRMLVAMTST
jgi:hypothetical protein